MFYNPDDPAEFRTMRSVPAYRHGHATGGYNALWISCSGRGKETLILSLSFNGSVRWHCMVYLIYSAAMSA